MALVNRSTMIIGCARRVDARLLLARTMASGPTMKGPKMVDLSKFASNEENQKKLPKEALDRDIQLRRDHVAMRMTYPEAAQPKEGPKVDSWLAHRKRLIYRSKQRGWLEVDLLLGSWATDHAMSLTDEEAAQYEAILNCETLDIYNMVTKQMEVPKVLQSPIMKKLQEYAATSPVGKADPTMYKKIKEKMSN